MDVHQRVARVDVGHEAVPPPELTSHPQRHLIVHDWDVYCALDSFIVEVAVGQSAIAAAIIVRSPRGHEHRSEEHTSELQSLMRISYAVFCLKQKNKNPSNTIKSLTDTYNVVSSRQTQYTKTP